MKKSALPLMIIFLWRNGCIVMRNTHVVGALFIVLMLLSGCTSQPSAQQTFSLADAQPAQRVTLQITLQNAHDQNGQPRDGTLAITSINDGQRSMHHLIATGNTAPIWLASVDNQAVFVTANQERRVIDGACTRDASGFPPVSIRDLLGPLQGFGQTAERWYSNYGGVAWQRFEANAHVDTHGILHAMKGQGQGKILLPGGDVITATIQWDYIVESYPVAIETPQTRCEAEGFTQISFPSAFGNATTMAGALLFTYTATLTHARDSLTSHWQSLGLSPTIIDQNQQSVTIEVTIQQQTVRAFLVQTNPQTIAITVIDITQ
jgi:hypothetical protein